MGKSGLMEQKTEIRKIVRFLATDINGELSVSRSLRRIPGISFMLTNAILQKTGIDGKKKLGAMTETEIKTLEAFVKSLGKENSELPMWIMNRRKDIETGTNVHVHGSELQFKKMEDINMLKRMHAYKGVRHEFGLPVRGQRTRSSFRTQKTVGVAKKKIQQAAKPAAKEEKK